MGEASGFDIAGLRVASRAAFDVEDVLKKLTQTEKIDLLSGRENLSLTNSIIPASRLFLTQLT